MFTSRLRFTHGGLRRTKGLDGLGGVWFATIFEGDLERFVRIERLLDHDGSLLGDVEDLKQAANFERESVAMAVENASEPLNDHQIVQVVAVNVRCRSGKLDWKTPRIDQRHVISGARDDVDLGKQILAATTTHVAVTLVPRWEAGNVPVEVDTDD